MVNATPPDKEPVDLGGSLEIGYLRGLTRSATSRITFYAGGSVQALKALASTKGIVSTSVTTVVDKTLEKAIKLLQ